jgi:hypothetical protein
MLATSVSAASTLQLRTSTRNQDVFRRGAQPGLGAARPLQFVLGHLQVRRERSLALVSIRCLLRHGCRLSSLDTTRRVSQCSLEQAASRSQHHRLLRSTRVRKWCHDHVSGYIPFPGSRESPWTGHGANPQTQVYSEPGDLSHLGHSARMDVGARPRSCVF